MCEGATWWKQQWEIAMSGWERALEREKILRAEVEAMRAVVDAARAHVVHLRLSDAIDLRAALDELDALPKEGGG